MSAEYTWEQLVADHDRDVAFQEKYLVIEPFDTKRLIEETRPILIRGQEILNAEKLPRSGIRTNISQIEIIYPFLLKKAGLLKQELPEWAITGEVQKGRIVGEELHKADAIFSTVFQGIRDTRLLRSYLPSYSDEELSRIGYAIRDLEISPNASFEKIRDTLFIAWGKYRNQIVTKDNLNIPLPGLGIVDPREEDRYRESTEIDEAAYDLAEAWAKEAVRLVPSTWEFGGNPEEEVVNQREILAIVKFIGPNLQVVSRLDSVLRKRKKSGKVRSQIIDFKTGEELLASSLDAEVKKRQAQLMRMITERFTSKYMTNFRSLVPRDRAFVMRARHDSKAYDRVDLCAYRYLDRDKKTLKIQKIDFEGEQREDFNLWFSWYGAMMHIFRHDVRRHVATNPNYKLSSVSISDKDLAKLYGEN